MKLMNVAEFKPAPKSQTIADRLERERQFARSMSQHDCVGKWVFAVDQQLVAIEDSYDGILETFDEDAEPFREAGASSLRVFRVLRPGVKLCPSVWGVGD